MSRAKDADFKFSEVELPLSRQAGGPRRRWITWRSVLLGVASVLFLAIVAPYNDHVLVSSVLVGSYFPPVMVMTFFVLTLLNIPLHRWLPKYALSSGELAVVMIMLLIACGISSYGCLNELIPMQVGPFVVMQGQPDSWRHFMALHLPPWLFPVPNLNDARLSHQVTWFQTRAPLGETPPYGSWIVPTLAWSVFIVGMFTTLIAVAALLRPQWAVNERLQFPLAQLETALIEAPQPGRGLNDFMRSPALWAGLLLALWFQSERMLNRYFPQHVPEPPWNYWLYDVLTREPWSYLPDYIKFQKFYLTFVGISFFIQSRVSFSLWSICLICALLKMVQRWQFQIEWPGGAWDAQSFGASIAFMIGLVWVGRKFFFGALRAAFTPRRWWPRESTASGASASVSPANSRWAARFALLGIAIMVGWLLLMGVQAWVACCIVFFLLLGHCVVARIVAETGMPFVASNVSFSDLIPVLPTGIFRGRDVFFSGFYAILGTIPSRESALTFAMHGFEVKQRLEDSTESDPGAETRRRRRRRLAALVGLMILALVVTYVVGAGCSLYCYYHYASPLARGAGGIKINPAGIGGWPKQGVVDPLDYYNQGHFPARGYNTWVHLGVGAAITGVLHFLSLRFRAWPFLPVGYLMQSSGLIQITWFSIFLGWLAKVLVVRFGGVKLYLKTRPFFVGLIFGEALAAGLWTIVTLVLAWTGHEYEQANVLIR